MLMRQDGWDSDGDVVDSVTLKDRTVFRIGLSGIVFSGIRLGSDGILYLFQANGGVSAVGGEWLVFGTASTFYVQRTITSGDLEVDAGAGFLQLNVNRDYNNQQTLVGESSATVFFEISSDVSGSPVVADATMIFTSEKTLP